MKNKIIRVMNKIKCISRSWLYPNNQPISLSSMEVYSVGNKGVAEISQNDSGCHNVEFETGEIISVTDVQYVEYYPNLKKDE